MSTQLIKQAIVQIQKARTLTSLFVDNTPNELFFRQPADGINHIGWHVGHLTVVQLQFVTGVMEDPDYACDIVPEGWAERFGRGSTPVTDTTGNPSVEELRAAFDKMHVELLTKITSLTDAQVVVPMPKPHPMFTSKLDALHFAALHESSHAGQIALLRRLFGLDRVI